MTGQLSSVGLFAGVGGFELGFARSGIDTQLVCELDAAARTILTRAAPNAAQSSDIRMLKALPKVDVVAAGFPCQNLSLVGSNEGIFGDQSGLVNEVFRLVKNRRNSPTWLVLENVPFMLWHKKGHAIRYVLSALEELGFRWAYRVVDTRSFGVPQRRRRVFIVASRSEDPKGVLFADSAKDPDRQWDRAAPCGFSWTEGRMGLGWAIDAVPTLKGGSAIGIPSPPAIWYPRTTYIGTPDIRDAERLQGFDEDWTNFDVEGRPIRIGYRWKLVGNAVSVPVTTWLGKRLVDPGSFNLARSAAWTRDVWPNAAWGEKGRVHSVDIGEFPVRRRYSGLEGFLKHPTKPLSKKATAGFLARARAGRLTFVDGFLDSVASHLSTVV